jgi:hypothetical protein
MNYGELKEAVIDRAHRPEIDPTGFIAIAHGRIVNDLQVSSMRKFVELDTSTSLNVIASVWSTPLPADTLKVMQVLANNTEIAFLDPARLQSVTQNDAGQASNYSIVGKELWTAPGVAGSLAVHYYERMAELMADSDTNEVLTNYPAVYLYASLVELYNSTQDGEQLAASANLYDSNMRMASDQMNTLNFGGLPRMK